MLTQSIQENVKSYKEIMNDITTFIFDVDGVLTDGSCICYQRR
jgi:3-deoxy-D-manno-octulosonate 8-phosphate phosphatase KdsC-like HAD superfamily phosphatase